MDVFVKKGAEPDVRVAEQPLDPRLAPTPDYGTLGPDSDFAKASGGLSSASPTPKSANPTDRRPVTTANLSLIRLLAVAGGIVAALFASGGRAVWKNIGGTSAPKRSTSVSSARFSDRELEREKPQKQAEILLARAVSHSGGANGEIEAHIEGWRGKLNWNPQLSQLTTVALNSDDQDVRTSGVEVQLAAYGLSKSDSTVNALLPEANSSDHARKIWALWALGLLGNRGVATDRVVQALVGHLKDSGKDAEDSRRWAIEGLALVGTSATIAPLLDSMHNDPSPLVRERAACSLAQSGMLSHEQRLTAVPQLINYSEDPALDAQTHAWAFQALHDITKQPLPNDSAAWRNWYQNSGASGQ